MTPNTDETESCPVCGWNWGGEPAECCFSCGRPPMSEYDTGLAEVPEPVATLDEKIGETDEARSRTSTTEKRLVEAGILHVRVGLETVGCGAWQSHRRAVARTALFDYLVADSVRAHVAFYQDYFGYDGVEAFLRAGDQGELTTCASKVAATWSWLRTHDLPTSPETVRRRSPFWETDSSREKQSAVPDASDTEQRSLTSF